MTLMVPYLSAALGVRVTLKDVSHHGNVTFLHCPVEGSLSILMEKDKVSHGLKKETINNFKRAQIKCCAEKVFFNCNCMCSSLKPVVVFLDTINAEKFTLPRKQEGEHKKASSFCLILTRPAVMNDKTGVPTCPLISISAYLFSRARTIST